MLCGTYLGLIVVVFSLVEQHPPDALVQKNIVRRKESQIESELVRLWQVKFSHKIPQDGHALTAAPVHVDGEHLPFIEALPLGGN